MSAIQRDREIAAKATQGKWEVLYDIGSPGADIIAPGEENRVVARYLTREDAEHIVRLHNRQPRHDALVGRIEARIGAGRDCPICERLPGLGHFPQCEYAALDREEP